MKEKAIIIDLDGTLCNIDHRLKYIKCKPKQRDKFHSLLHKDTINIWCHSIINSMSSLYNIILLTGRSGKYEEETKKWLLKNGVKYDALIMRTEGDYRADNIVKEEIYKKYIAPSYEILFVVEDRPIVIQMWRRIGLTTLDCGGWKE